jgi:Transposase IS200 like
VVFCPKYRKPVLNPPIDAKLKKLIQQVCDETQLAMSLTGGRGAPRLFLTLAELAICPSRQGFPYRA